MILVAGLGNIGAEYENTRHNAGFMLLDLLTEILSGAKLELSALPPQLSAIAKTFPFSNFASKTVISKPLFKGEVLKFNNLILLKPHTFMNTSGLSVRAVKDFYKCERLIVLHDDLDLELGALKFKKGGGSGGHNGLKSIDECVGNDYERVRLGIGKPQNKGEVIHFVLNKFNQKELQNLQNTFKLGVLALLELINGTGLEKVNSSFSLKKATEFLNAKNGENAKFEKQNEVNEKKSTAKVQDENKICLEKKAKNSLENENFTKEIQKASQESKNTQSLLASPHSFTKTQICSKQKQIHRLKSQANNDKEKL